MGCLTATERIWSTSCHCQLIISCFIKIYLSDASLPMLSWKRGL